MINEKASFSLRGRNPDVLSCIANLSNDEVFTPPEIANRMLDMIEDAWREDHNGESIWTNPKIRFQDPCAKSGVFLREITKRLTAGLEKTMPDLEERVTHILRNQVFGIGITRLTSLLARRSVYCSKHANGPHSIAKLLGTESGNIWFKKTEHSWNEGKCVFCGANKRDYDRGPDLETHAYAFIHAEDPSRNLEKIFGENMQFDVIIGNPPYQLGQSGGESVGGFAMPIYQKFVQVAKNLEPRYVAFVTPSRWFAGGRGLDEFRSEMLSDTRIRRLVDYPDGSEVFPGTQIEGGVSYFLWDSSWREGCEVSTIQAGAATSPPMKRFLGKYDIVVRRNEAVPILEKVLRTNQSDEFGNLSSKVSPIQPFSIRTNFRGQPDAKGLKKPIRIFRNGGIDFMERTDVPRNDSWIDDWKVLLGSAYGAGNTQPYQIYNYPIIAEPGTACTETYLVISRFKSEKEAIRCANYLKTRFVRFLVSLRKNTQHLYNERFQFVPDLPMNQDWSDEKLYEKYKITKKEVSFINSMIRSMENPNE